MFILFIYLFSFYLREEINSLKNNERTLLVDHISIVKKYIIFLFREVSFMLFLDFYLVRKWIAIEIYFPDLILCF